MSTLKNDLALFNELVEVLIEEEQQNPVAERIEANQLYDTLDLSLSHNPMVDDRFKSLLSNVLITTPKQLRIYFLTNFLEEDSPKQY